MFLADSWTDYEVLDTGDGEKLERWGDIILRRPDPQTIWPKGKEALWRKAMAHYHRSERGGGEWEFLQKLPDRWTVCHEGLTFWVRPTGFKHTGLFPEQAANWIWMSDLIRKDGRKDLKILNLFGYTGGATLACAAAGAHVTHVDAAKGMVLWAKENRELSGLPETSFRWIVEDALRFVQRDPPRKPLRRDPDGSAELWPGTGRRGVETGERTVRPDRHLRPGAERRTAVFPDQQLYHRIPGQRAEQHAGQMRDPALRRAGGQRGALPAGDHRRSVALRRQREVAACLTFFMKTTMCWLR